MKINNRSSVWAGVLAAFAASSCCILPLLAAIGGVSSGFASSLAWVEPLRPYLLTVTLGLFGFAFYRTYRPKAAAICDCETAPSSWQSKGVLWSVFALSLLLMAFPYYSKTLYPSDKTASEEIIQPFALQTITVNIAGMSCAGCEKHLRLELRKVPGVLETEASYDAGNAVVKFDPSKTSIESIYQAVKSAGYVPQVEQPAATGKDSIEKSCCNAPVSQ